MKRPCAICRQLVESSDWERHRQAHKNETRAPTSVRYGAAHRRLRAEWAKRIERGGVLCARCGDPIVPGTPWELGHVDGDPSRYTGPEHQLCNRQTASHAAQRRDADT